MELDIKANQSQRVQFDAGQKVCNEIGGSGSILDTVCTFRSSFRKGMKRDCSWPTVHIPPWRNGCFSTLEVVKKL